MYYQSHKKRSKLVLLFSQKVSFILDTLQANPLNISASHCRSGMVFAINPPSPPQPGYGAFRNRAIPGSAGCDSDLKVSIQKMTGLAGVALLIGLLL